MEVTEYIGFVASEGELFAAAAEQGDLARQIAHCPDWDMGDLVRHLGMIHLWAAANVAYPGNDWLDVKELPDLVRYWPDLAGDGSYPHDPVLVDWYRDTLANLLDVLKSAPADLECFAFLPAATPLTMWARRQASEIAIHRFDAQHARGISTSFDPQFAEDMLDELLFGFTPRPRELDIEGTKVIHIDSADTDTHWYLAVSPTGVETTREGDHGDLTLTGNAEDLYVLLWNREPESAVVMTGDTDLLGLWHRNFRVRWG